MKVKLATFVFLVTLVTLVTLTSVVRGQIDITDLLEQQIAAHQPIELDRGDYYITRTIKFPPRYGGSITGVGVAAAHLSTNNPYNWMSTRIFWRGEKNGTMFEANGSHQHFGDIALIGAPKWNTPVIPGVTGIKVMKARGLGSGKHSFERVWFQHLQNGAQFGESENGSGSNCDESYFENCHFQDCHSAVRYEQAQSIGFTFLHCFYSRCFRIHDIMAGGHITSYKSVVVNVPQNGTSTFFYFTNEADRRYRIGTSAGMITSYNLKVDKQCLDKFRAIFMDSNVNGPTVTFRDAQVSHRDYGALPFVVASGPVKIVIDNCRFPQFTTASYRFSLDDRNRFPSLVEISQLPVVLSRN